MRIVRIILLFLCLSCLFGASKGTGVRIENLQFENGKACFELQWEHAWNTPTALGSYDAVWVFLKGREAAGDFRALSVSSAVAASGNFSVDLSPDGMGVFVIPPVGHKGETGVQQICLDLAGIDADALAEIRVYAIEMVWIPTAGFWLGDGQSNGSMTTPDGLPVWVGSEDLVPASALQDTGSAKPAGDIPSAWPKGHEGFYCMKHELSILQYCDFLNTLTYPQQASRTAISPSSPAGSLALSGSVMARNGLRVRMPGVVDQVPATYGISLDGQDYSEEANGIHRACNWISWDDLAAYLDWAGLRPMTEWEFEKACRGPLAPLPGEFAWGTDAVVDANSLVFDGSFEEMVSEKGDSLSGLASHGYAGPQGPIRTGFAATDSTSRVMAGAGYWGVMELSGNLWELCVNVTAEGLLYERVAGDGKLDMDGFADQPTWPGAEGAGFRGGGWNSGIIPGFRDLAVSDRFYAGMAPTTRRPTSGGRGVR